MAEYRISKVAKQDLIRIHQYGTSQFGEKQADKYFDAFFEKFDQIAKNPYSFESVEFIKSGYRKCVSGVDTIYYRINNDVVEIMTIIGRQDRIDHLNKLGWTKSISNIRQMPLLVLGHPKTSKAWLAKRFIYLFREEIRP